MDKVANIFRVEYGSIYKNDADCIIENMAFIISRDSSVLKYGDKNTGLYDYYLDISSKYKECGLEDMANNLFYIEFDRYDGVLTVEEICTFANYIVMCSCNGETIYNMLKMNEAELKSKIKTLAGYGY